MSQGVPAAAREHVDIDNLPTGNVELHIRRDEMPDKLLVSRYWNGMEKPEQLAYVPERKKVYLVETSDDLIESWHPTGVYLHREAAGDCAEALRKEEDGVRQFARVIELRVVDE